MDWKKISQTCDKKIIYYIEIQMAKACFSDWNGPILGEKFISFDPDFLFSGLP